MSESIGKQAEKRVREWLNRPEDGYCFDRIPDQVSGLWGSSNISDFILFKQPYFYYIESKATIHDRFDFTMITEIQRLGMVKKSKIENVFGVVIVLFVEHKRAFIFDINDIQGLIDEDIKSLNIKKIDKWQIKYQEIKTIPSRKNLLEYDKNQKFWMSAAR